MEVKKLVTIFLSARLSRQGQFCSTNILADDSEVWPWLWHVTCTLETTFLLEKTKDTHERHGRLGPVTCPGRAPRRRRASGWALPRPPRPPLPPAHPGGLGGLRVLSAQRLAVAAASVFLDLTPTVLLGVGLASSKVSSNWNFSVWPCLPSSWSSGAGRGSEELCSGTTRDCPPKCPKCPGRQDGPGLPTPPTEDEQYSLWSPPG